VQSSKELLYPDLPEDFLRSKGIYFSKSFPFPLPTHAVLVYSSTFYSEYKDYRFQLCKTDLTIEIS
jgi:hypothetical protein